ncbi:uncharacterized protein THITE_2117103 [Thermothielavioides terrestris NRRL 8126]|uniref:Uncharacterized protein n=1 Tax=Thermothielavioides terrestris (strain ATCC 38088 / NRRL 8126) TaxID=578455 RepID=G2R7L6_THETT|nr:uncharacterized protein THITE_2117103 [Thermothielavioides terrestris NRRL 8126]AEO67925.1 hypothetical protein THITE_2117103 [Thermothielavioides terrestris NRRL 8126]
MLRRSKFNLTSLAARTWALVLALALFLLAPQAHALPTQTAWPPHSKSVRPQRPCFAQRNFNTISRIYNLTVYPNNVPIIQAGGAAVPRGLFSQDVVGRVDPVGNFTSFEDSIEYFFALAPLPTGNAAEAAITGYQITEFSSQCRDVASSVVYLYCSVWNPGQADHLKPLPPLKQVAFWRFDKHGAVLYYDAWIPNLNSWVQTTTAAYVGDAAYQAASIEQICGGTQARCTGANTQWNSTAECVAALSAKPYGTYDEAWGDNIVCRSIHLVLTQVRPDVHCPHVGPTGGGKCVDIAYPENYFSDEELYGQPAGETFMCK